ncbi:hypothetical protein [Streptomyces misionensis]
MAELKFEHLKARAINNLDEALSDTADKEALLARAQVHALLAVAAALKEVAEAVREGQ